MNKNELMDEILKLNENKEKNSDLNKESDKKENEKVDNEKKLDEEKIKVNKDNQKEEENSKK